MSSDLIAASFLTTACRRNLPTKQMSLDIPKQRHCTDTEIDVLNLNARETLILSKDEVNLIHYSITLREE